MTKELDPKTAGIPTARGFPTAHLEWDKVEPVYTGGYQYGTKSRTKMLLFLERYPLSDQEIIEYRKMTPARYPEEDYLSYRKRRVFQQQLLNHRNVIKQFILKKAMQDLLNEKVNKKEQ